MQVQTIEIVLEKFLTNLFLIENTIFTNVPVLKDKERIFSLTVIPMWENHKLKKLESISIDLKNVFENDVEIVDIYQFGQLCDKILEDTINKHANQNIDWFWKSTLRLSAITSDGMQFRREI